MGLVDFACKEAVDHELLFHDLFLHRLRVHFGIRCKALAWFTSYLGVASMSLAEAQIHPLPA